MQERKIFKVIKKLVLNDSDNVLINSVEDLVFLINKEIYQDERIDAVDLQHWLDLLKRGDADPNEVYLFFADALRTALVREKKNLFSHYRRLATKKTEIDKYGWMLERTFPENFNLTQKHEINAIPTKIIVERSHKEQEPTEPPKQEENESST